jgi:cytochrome c-type biogenesis protein CcmH/NrfF
MYPAKWFYRHHEEEPTTEVAIRRGFAEDVYIVMPAFDPKDQSASLHIVINPLVDWIWVGFAVIAIGTGIALLPERAYSFAVAKLPPDVATSTTALLALLAVLGMAADARAQHVESGTTVPVIARSPLERDMQKKLICMCRTCGRQLLSECTCSKAVEMRAELAKLVADGKSEQQIVDYYIAQYGSEEPLASPIDRGFNRLAWAVPYVAGSAGLVLVGIVAVRWTRRKPGTPQAPSVEPADSVDPALESRLDDELRDLD